MKLLLFFSLAIGLQAAQWAATSWIELAAGASETIYIQQSGAGAVTISQVNGVCGANAFSIAEYSGGTAAGSAIDVPAAGANATFLETVASPTGSLVGSATTFAAPSNPGMSKLGIVTVGTTLAGGSGSVLAFTITNGGTKPCSGSLAIYGQ